MIRIEHINKSFGSQQVLRDVTLEIPDGQIVGLLGPNGAGKSTLMKILMGLWRPDSGSVSVPERIGYLPENNPLYEDMYVSEYLAFMAGLTNSQFSIVNSQFSIVNSQFSILNSQLPNISSLIDLVGLTPERHKHIRELSKGYRQRVGLAQALLGDPELLILDEPTTGLDPNQLVEIRSLIKSLSKLPPSGGGTGWGCPSIILSTHIMQEVREMCDRVIILDHGAVKADLPIDEIPDLETLFHEKTSTTR
ncbi:MAG: ATP-binding cassette domain-containing protein [Paludibacteraceae bacterium]|nr:ATP-binding cassette domain-containing protein [Paludibacteraceae bacterium]